MGNLGAVAIKSVEVVFEILLETGHLHELALVRCILLNFKDVIVMLVHWFVLVIRWLSLKLVNFRLVCWFKT